MRVYFLVLCALVSVGCGKKINFNNSAEVAPHIRYQYDPFKREVRFTGPDIPVRTSGFSKAFLRAWKTEAMSSFAFQVYVVSHYIGDWRRYSRAYDLKGNRFDVTQIDRSVYSCRGLSGCQLIEDVGINVSETYLIENKDVGVLFKIEGPGGSELVGLQKGYLQAFLEKINNDQGRK